LALKPWYKVVTPREDLRDGRPLDASEFAVHLDQVREGRAPDVYKNPEEFFERTYLTKSLKELATQVLRRLSGETTETSAVFNMATQFGGGKTHALTLLYHLAKNGSASDGWRGVRALLDDAKVATVPDAATAIFVGTEFDVLEGRGGENDEPIRRTPWGEVAFQLGGVPGFEVVREHDDQQVAPAGDVIRKFLPNDRPSLILMDELLNYVSRGRKFKVGDQLYDFLQNLGEEARARTDVVLAVSIPASELEMGADDFADYERFRKMLNRIGRPIMMAAEAETSEIIRRRLFEWGGVPKDGKDAALAHAEWVQEHRQQLPDWFPVDKAYDQFETTYPFHPSVISVFERKWQTLPNFQRTRAVLRFLALWVSHAYSEGYTGAHKDLLIGLGTAPLEDPQFRAAVFQQLGEDKLDAAVTTDIAGKVDSHAVVMDKKAVDSIGKARLHQKVATSVFFESSGGQVQEDASAPEIRLASAEPSLDIGNVETVLEDLAGACYYLTVQGSRYRFSLQPNLNHLLADKKAGVSGERIEERVRREILTVFRDAKGISPVAFPESSSSIPDRPAPTVVVMSPDMVAGDAATTATIQKWTADHGASSRTFKGALIWCTAGRDNHMDAQARQALAWEDIKDEAKQRKLDEDQKRQVEEHIERSRRDTREAVWRAYRYITILDKDQTLKQIDLGLVHSSSAGSMLELILNRLTADGHIEEGISPNFLARNWPPAFQEWSTKAVRDAFYASPQFPLLLDPDGVRDTIARGVQAGVFGYGGKSNGGYEPFYFHEGMSLLDVEIADDMYLIPKDIAVAYAAGEKPSPPPPVEAPVDTPPGETDEGDDAEPHEVPAAAASLAWTGDVPTQKWMNFYTKILSRFSTDGGLSLRVTFEVEPDGGLSNQRLEETRAALRELGLEDDIETT